jgi:hypothetical protein
MVVDNFMTYSPNPYEYGTVSWERFNLNQGTPISQPIDPLVLDSSRMADAGYYAQSVSFNNI